MGSVLRSDRDLVASPAERALSALSRPRRENLATDPGARMASGKAAHGYPRWPLALCQAGAGAASFQSFPKRPAFLRFPRALPRCGISDLSEKTENCQAGGLQVELQACGSAETPLATANIPLACCQLRIDIPM